ncbi:MAG: polysaccharide deacetylase family protein [bacterium]|nr:polysaccharide deacetylase family protein [bacterium]
MFRLPPHLSKRIAVTFDDGPHPETTLPLLNTLAHLRIPSTHFIVGEKAAAHPDLLPEINAQGHLLANHGYCHESLLWKSKTTQAESLTETDAVLRRQNIRFGKYFRPPFGQFNFSTKSVLALHGYRGVLWSVAIADWKAATSQELWRRLRPQIHERAVILLHDTRVAAPAVIEMLSRLADDISRRGWEFTTLPVPPTDSAS